MLLNLINSLNDDDDFERRVKTYLNSQIIIDKGVTGILLQKDEKIVLVVKLEDKWVPVIENSEEYIDLSVKIQEKIEDLVPAKSKLNKIIGFITSFKNKFMVFKLKNLTQKRDKGSRCDQKTGKGDAIKRLNEIIGEDKYALDTDISQKQLCIMQEFYLRLYNKEKRNSKRWFLIPAEVSLINIEKVNF
jgi:hypothetical protein